MADFRIRSRAVLVATVVLLLTQLAVADEQIDQLVRQLADPNPVTRDQAADKLAKLPPAKKPALEAAADDAQLPAESRFIVKQAIGAIDARAVRKQRKTDHDADLRWWKSQTTDAYQAVGQRDPKWDEPAAGGLRTWEWAIMATAFYYEDMTQETWNGVTNAVKAGCNDPLIKYVHGWADTRVLHQPRLESYLEAARGIRDSKYSPYIKYVVLMQGANYSCNEKFEQTADLKAERQAWMKSAMDLLPDVLDDDQLPRPVFLNLLELTSRVSDTVEDDRTIWFNKAYAACEKAGVPKAVLLAARATMHISHAWDARGGGWARTVTPESAKLFQERLALAAADAEESWKLDDTNGDTCRSMIAVCVGTGRPRAEMEQWFQRAMKIDPDDLNACREKLHWLRPRWHGSNEELLAFGRECLAGGNFEGAIPTVLMMAHAYIAADHDDVAAYYRQPQVWADAQAVYLPMMRRHPQSKLMRSRYLLVASQAEQWDEVRRLLPKFAGNGEWSYWIYTKKSLEELREKVAKLPPTTQPK